MAPETPLPPDLREILRTSFFIAITTRGRRTGFDRLTETTYVWDGARAIYISGYPGRRDWAANIAADPSVRVSTVEGQAWYDIAATARLVRDRGQRTVHLLAFLDRWATRPEAPRRLFGLIVGAIRLNRGLHLPWWGPFYLARRVLDRMPCVEITLTGEPVRRSVAPPTSSQLASE